MATLLGVNLELAKRIRWVMAEAEKYRRGQAFWITTGARSMAEQQRLWSVWQAGLRTYGSQAAAQAAGVALAAKPGTSMHGRDPALAVDLACDAVDNALRVRLFSEASLITPVPREPWHAQLALKPKPLPITVIGDVPELKETDDMPAPTTVMDAVVTEDGQGTWRLQYDGGILTSGSAPFYGSYPALLPEQRQGVRNFVAIERTDDGYVIIADDGAAYAFNDSVLKDLQAKGRL